MRLLHRLAGGALLGALSLSVHATSCGGQNYPFPYTDVTAVGDAFCPGIMHAYVLGVTRGTTPTTFAPNSDVTRLQMTTFLQRSFDQSIRRSSRRAALGQWWTYSGAGIQLVVSASPSFCKSDGDYVYFADDTGMMAIRTVGGINVKPLNLQGYTPARRAQGLVVAHGMVYVVSPQSTQLLVVQIWAELFDAYLQVEQSFTLPIQPNNLTFDGSRMWTANYAYGSVARIPMVREITYPWAQVDLANIQILQGFNYPADVLFDGRNIWVSEGGADRIAKLDADGNVLQRVAVGDNPGYMAFDGANIWVPNHNGNSISVVQASTGTVVATIGATAANGLNGPLQAAFDGERILVTNRTGDSVTLFRAADLSLIANVALPAGAQPWGACSDGVDFWVAMPGIQRVGRL